MAENNVYTIILKNETTSATQKRQAVVLMGGGSETLAASGGETSASRVGMGAGIALAIGSAKPYVNLAVSHRINQVRIGTGQNEYAQKLSFSQQIANDGLTVLNAGLVGTSMGGLGTGFGMAMFTAGGIVVSKGISLWQNQETINMSEAVESSLLGYARNRAGFNQSRGRHQ